MDREILKAALAPGPGCLPLERLGRYADAALDANEQAAAAAHIRTCPNCQAELAMLKTFTSGTMPPAEAAVGRDGIARLDRRPSFPLNAARAAAIAAVVVLASVSGAVYFRSSTPPALPTTVNAGDDVTRSQTIAVRAPVGDLRESPARFEWNAIARASRYRVRLMEVDRREVWSASTADTGIQLPPEVRALSVPSKTLIWDVTAYDSSGVAIAESGSQAFRLTPR